MFRREIGFRIILMMVCCAVLSFIMGFAVAESEKPEDGKESLSLFAYVENGRGYADEWFRKIADTTVATAVFYSDAYDVSIQVYRIARAWGDGNPPIHMGTYEITKKSLSRLYADLTNDGLTKELREQKDNRVLNTENMKLMMGTIRDDPADRKLLLVFSNVIQEVWMGDEEVYAAWRQSECPFGLFSYGAMSIPQDLFQNSNRVLLDQIMQIPPAQIAVNTIEGITGDVLQLTKIDEEWKAAADGIRVNRRVISTEKLETGYNIYGTDGLTVFDPPDDMNLEVKSLGDAWLQYESMMTGTVSTKARWEKNQEITVQLEIRNQFNQRLESLEGWSATAELLDSDGKRLQQTRFAVEDGLFTGLFSPLETEGVYTISATASYDRMGITAEIKGTQFNLDNKAPVCEQTNREEIRLWSWIPQYSLKSIKLTDFFSDDSDTGELSFQMSPENVPGFTINGPYLNIDASLLEKQVTEVRITAKDREEDKSVNAASFWVTRYLLTDLWTLEAGITSTEPTQGYGKNDQISVYAHLVRSNIPLPEGIEAEGWQVSVLKNDLTTLCQMTGDGFEYTGEFTIDRKGTYELYAMASLGEWQVGPVEMGRVYVKNIAPTWQSEMPETIVLWKNCQAEYDQSMFLSYNLEKQFSDDTNRPLTYTIKSTPETAGVFMNENQLKLDPDQLTDGTFSVEITAQDDEEMSESHIIQVVCRDVIVRLNQEDAFTAHVSIRQKAPFYKDSPITVDMEVTCGEGLLEYERQLNEEALAAFHKDFSLAFTGMDEIKSEPVELSFDQDGKMTASVDLPNPRPVGEHTITGILSVPNRNDRIEGTASFTVKNRPPVLTQHNKQSATLIIPGPLFLNQDIEAPSYEIPIGKMIETEALDVLTIRIQGMRDGHFVANQDGSWLYTDADEPVSDLPSIQWKQEEEFKGLKIQPVRHNQYELTMTVEDNDGESIEIPITLKTEYKDEKKLLMISIAISAMIVLLIMTLLLHQLLKPTFRENDILHVEANGVKHEVHTEDWKKKGITLRELLIYSGAPLLGDVNMKACDKILFMPGRARKNILCRVKNKASSGDLRVWIYSTEQNSRKVKVPLGEEVEIRFEHGAAVKIS